ncbi:MAG: PAS domain S-box protein, partial [Candidatus Hodarchaeales archaeon]
MEFSKDKFIQVIEGIKECYFEVDLKGNFTFFNESLCKLIDYSREELWGLNYKFIVDEEKRKDVFEGFNSVFITGEPLTDFEYQFKNKNGEKIIGETSVYLKIDANGNKIGFYGIFRDVTKRKKQEEKFRLELAELVTLRTQELRDSEEKYSNLFHYSNDAIILHDLEGNILDVNERVLEQFGYSREEILQLKIGELHPTSELEASRKAFEEIIENGFVRFEIKFRTKNNKDFLAEVSSSIFDVGDKKVIQGVIRDITVRVLTEKRLKESEEKYHQLFNKSPYPIGLFDLEGNLIDANSATNNLLSTHVIEDYIGKNYREFWAYNENDKPLIVLFNSIFEEIMSTGKTLNFEFPIHRTRGGVIWSYATASKIKIGKEQFIQLILVDRTIQKEAQQKLKESEEKYRNLVENAQEGVWAVDENDDTIFVNPKLCEMLGYTREEIMSQNLQNFLEDPMIELIDSYRGRRGKGLKDTYELEFIKKDGTILSTSINASPILNENGEFNGSFAFITDITNRKLAEQKLKESEARYRKLIESVPFSIALIDLQGKLIYCNPALENLINYSKDELIGNEFKNLPAVNPEYIPILLRRFQKVIKGEILPPLEMEIYRKDGNSIWIKYQSSLVKLGDQILLQTVINDITEQRKADLLIEEELVKLKDLDQIRKDLISRVSHELKTPLVSVCGAAELLLDSYIEQFKGDTKELIEMIEKGGKRLKYLVDNLVDITRIEYRKFELDIGTNNLSQIIRDCTKELMFLIKKREINLELDLLDNFSLKFDKVRIEQVILNLLSNAIKNTPPNGKITVRTSKNDDNVELLIQDSGIGLTKEEMDKLFTRFGKIERCGNGLEYIDIQGTGLGLFISKEIIDLHKGQIWATSQGRDKGSTFTIRLPI